MGKQGIEPRAIGLVPKMLPLHHIPSCRIANIYWPYKYGAVILRKFNVISQDYWN